MNSSPILLTLIVICLGFLPELHAVNPPPDGGYPGGNTAEGQSALLGRTTGIYNTGIGIYSLLSLTEGSFCTGVGAGTLLVNHGNQNTATGAGALLNNISGTDNTADGKRGACPTTGRRRDIATCAGHKPFYNSVFSTELALSR